MECPKCGYVRHEREAVPDWECPQCGIVYAKYEQEHDSPVHRFDETFQPSGVDVGEPITRGLLGSIKHEIDSWCKGRFWPGRALLLLFCIYLGVRFTLNPAYHSIFSGINLGIHEAGHPLFSYFGRFLHAAGGTILQLAAPLAAIGLFLRQRDFFAVTAAGFWLATNLYGVSVYMADARALALPLVTIGGGGGLVTEMHDWHFMFSRLGLLSYDTVIAGAVRVLAFCTMWGSNLLGAWIVWRMAAGTRSLPPPSRQDTSHQDLVSQSMR